jgi:hypothetical protein
MRAILLLTILMTSGDFDKQKQEQFEKERPLFQRNHQKRFAAVTHFRGFSQPPERQNVNTAANSQDARRQVNFLQSQHFRYETSPLKHSH